MGKVYRALRLHIGDEVVIKLLDKRYLADEEAAERFRREAQAAAKIRHQNVVVIHDFGDAQGDDTPAFIVMELVGGVSLKDVLTTEGPLNVTRTISIMREICRGVGAGHDTGVIHRDIKPSNIIVLTDDEGHETVKVVDFGLAKLRDETGDPSVTQVGVIVGTPIYMSPEQCRAEALDVRSDVYSLGVLTYEMLTGSVPFSGSSVASTCAKHQFEVPPPFPTDLNVPRGIESVVMRALAKNRNDRQENVATYSLELRAADGETKRARLVDGMYSTMEDAPAEAVPPSNENAIPDPQSKHWMVFDWSWQKALERGRTENIEVDQILKTAASDGMSKSDALQLLEILLQKKYIETAINRGGEWPFDHYSLTTSGFDEYAKIFIENYESIKETVVSHIVQGGIDNNLTIAEATTQPRLLINQILNLLSQNGLISVSKRLGGKVVITGVSDELKCNIPLFRTSHN